MIAIQNISKVYNAGKINEVQALNKVSLQLQPAEFLVVIGANGSGKSTLLNALAGVIQVDEGSVFLDKKEVTHLPEHKRSPWVARVFQNPMLGVASGLSILENFRLAALRGGSKSLVMGNNAAFRKQVEERIALLGMGLENKVQQPMGTLSGGQRQALTLLMSTMAETSVLLLDEPTAALDPKSAATVMELSEKIIRQYKLTAMMVTHSLRDAHRYGDRLVQMSEGRLVKDVAGSEKQVLSLPDIYKWFE